MAACVCGRGAATAANSRWFLPLAATRRTRRSRRTHRLRNMCRRPKRCTADKPTPYKKKAAASPTEEGAAERSGGQNGAEIDNRSGNEARRGANVSRRRGEGGFVPGTPAAPPAGVGLQKWHFGQIAPFEPSLHRGSKKPKHRYRTTSIDGDSPTDLRSPPAGDPGRSASIHSHSAA